MVTYPTHLVIAPSPFPSQRPTVRLTRAQAHRLIETYGYSGPGGSPAGVVECRGGGASWPASKRNARILCVSAWCSRTALTGSTAAITASRRATRSSFAATASTPLPLESRKAPSEPFGNSGQQPPRPASACRKRPFTTHADQLRPRLEGGRLPVAGPATRRAAGRCCTNRHWPARCPPPGSSPAEAIRHWSAEGGHPIEDRTAENGLTPHRFA